MNEYRTFQYALKIREHHLDTFGHVNNAVYLELLEEARWDILNAKNYGIKKIRESGQGPVILEISLSFRHELLLLADITIHTQVEAYEGKICTLRQTIVDASGKLCCEAKFKMALFDLRSRRLIVPTPEWLDAIT